MPAKTVRKDPAQRPRGRNRKATICFGQHAWKRLVDHAAGTGLSHSAIVEAAILAHCTRFVLHDLGERKGGGEPPRQDAPCDA